MKNYKEFLNENFNNLTMFGKQLYSFVTKDLQKISELEDVFPKTKVINDWNDNSKSLVFHQSDKKFSKFKTPAFFGTSDLAYSGEYTYSCILNIENPLDLRMARIGEEKFLEILAEIFKDDEYYEKRMKFAKQYGDAYGFFKIIANINDNFGEYRWDLITDYLNKNKYDGLIYKESDQSISYYFDGYLVLKPDQIKILAIK